MASIGLPAAFAPRFADREQAGRALVPSLQALRLVDPLVLALPRGGLPVAAPIARALHAPLDVVLVRKIGAPGNPEYAVAAVAEDAGSRPVVDEEALGAAGGGRDWLQAQAAIQEGELDRRRQLYRHGQPLPDLAGRTVVLVDDGVATGTTVRAAVEALRRHRAARIVLALPVAPADTAVQLATLVDDFVCLRRPVRFRAVGDHYEDFGQVSDQHALAILQAAGGRPAGASRQQVP